MLLAQWIFKKVITDATLKPIMSVIVVAPIIRFPASNTGTYCHIGRFATATHRMPHAHFENQFDAITVL
jgi:hypothetical protein